MTDDDVRRQIDQLLCKNFDAADVTASPAVIDLEIAALAPTELVETLPKYLNARTCVRVVLGGRHQHANPAHPLALLRPPRERPGDRGAAKGGNELPSCDVDRHRSSLGGSRAQDRCKR